MSEYPINDLCENCHILDGISVVEGMLVCFRCGRKMKKEEKKRGRQNGRRRTRQETSPDVSE